MPNKMLSIISDLHSPFFWQIQYYIHYLLVIESHGKSSNLLVLFTLAIHTRRRPQRFRNRTFSKIQKHL